MEQSDARELSPEFQGIVFQAVGLFDILLGAALAFLGPRFIGGAPVIDTFLQIGGAILAVSGIGIIAWARARTRIARGASDSDPVFKVNG